MAGPDTDFVVMVKPQFEVGRAALGTGGVVRNPRLRVDAVVGVAEAAGSIGLGVRAVCASPLPGQAGNVEYFLWLDASAPAVDRGIVQRVVSDGPQ